MKPFALSLIALAACATAQAQTAPLRNSPTPAVAASAPTLAPSTQGRFLLKEVRFSPTKAVRADELQAVVRPFIGREIDSTDLTVIATAVRRLYDQRGFGMAGVGYPQQDLSAGVLQVSIVEPQVGQLSIESPPKPPVSAERTTRVLEAAGVRKGQPLDLQALDRAMYTLNDWPGVSAKATLLPTGDEGLYKISVQTEARRAWDASIDLDNHGSASSGRYRLGTLLRWNNPAGIGDNLDLRLMASDGNGTTVGRLGYEAPLGATPWRAGVGYSRVGYELGEQFAAAGISGRADVIDASVSYPLVRGKERNLVGRFGLMNKQLHDEVATLSTSEKTIRAAELSFSFESRSSWGGGAFQGGSLGLVLGSLSYDSGNGAANAGAASEGSFSKLSLQLSRLQALGRGFSFFVGMAGQFTGETLDNAERFTLGGDKGVRAYPVAEGSSDMGAIVNTEVRWWVNPQWSTYTFFDWGHGRDKVRATGAENQRRTLRGYGLGVQFSHPDVFTLKASFGIRGSEPVRSETENPKSRLLVQVQRSF